MVLWLVVVWIIVLTLTLAAWNISYVLGIAVTLVLALISRPVYRYARDRGIFGRIETEVETEMADLDDPDWASLFARFELGACVLVSFMLTPVIARTIVGSNPGDMGFGGMVFLLIGFALALIISGSFMAFQSQWKQDRYALRFAFDAGAVFLAGHLLVSEFAPPEPLSEQELAEQRHQEDIARQKLDAMQAEGQKVVEARKAEQDRRDAKKRIQKDLFAAAESGDLARVMQSLRDGADVNAQDNGRTPLLIVLAQPSKKFPWETRRDIVRVLIGKGADVRARTGSGFSALTSYSAYDPEIVEMLARRKADPNVCMDDGESPWKLFLRWQRFEGKTSGDVIAFANRFPQLSLPLRADGSACAGPLHVFSAQPELIAYFLKRGFSATQADPEGRQPLHWAGSNRLPVQEETAAVDLLVAAGADIHAVDNSGHTPLFYACDNPKLVRHLVSLGADAGACQRQEASEPAPPRQVDWAFKKKK